jgi:membrane protease YdiL (CAAX protease family)
MNIPKLDKPSRLASRSLTEVVRNHPLFSYFFMAYIFSWTMTVPVLLAERGFLPGALFNIFFIVKAFAGPFLAAFIMVSICEGKEGLVHFRHRFFQTQAGWYWYLGILLCIPALFLLGIMIQPGTMATFQGLPHNSLAYLLVNYLVNFVMIFFLGGPLAEEPGWRGFALPHMQSRFGALGGALLLGVVWAFWHLPDFLTHAQGGGPGTGWSTFFSNFPVFVLLVILINLVMTWVYNQTQGSLFIAFLLHASINTAGILSELFPTSGTPMMTLSNLALLIGMAVPALLIVILTRGRLGYQAGMEQRQELAEKLVRKQKTE